MRIAVVASHPIQYQAPLFRELATRADIQVFFAHRASALDQSVAGFGVGFEWDIDLLSGYQYEFVENTASRPGLDHFAGCDNPSIGTQLLRHSPDALLVMGWNRKCYWQAIWAAKRAGVSVMVRGDSHLETPRSSLKRAVKAIAYPLGLRVFDAGLYVGTHSRRYWEHYGYPQQRLFFSPHCVDNAWFAARATEEARVDLRSAHGIPMTARVILFAGKLLSFKRPMDVVSAAKLAQADVETITVLVAGSGPIGEELEAHARASCVRLVQLGFCNQSKMPHAYAAADVLVLPSDGRETWGLVANEALACGIPIIVSEACGCAPDLAADGTAGRVVPTGDVSALAAAVSDIFKHPPSTTTIEAKANRYSHYAAANGVMEAAHATVRKRVN